MKDLKQVILENKNSEFLVFIKNILKWEKERVDNYFTKDSYYEDINEKFGIFPKTKLYPMYFYGDIENPKDKYIFIGINPSYDKRTCDEEYKDEKGSMDDYYNFLKSAFLKWKEERYYDNKLFSYLNRNISLCLEKGFNVDRKKISYDWLQNNVINLEFLPYHSKKADGLVLNNLDDYFETNFKVLERFIKYLNPDKKIVIFGFPKIIELLELDKKNRIEFNKEGSVYIGKLFGYPFVGVGFRSSGEDLEKIKNQYDRDKIF